MPADHASPAPALALDLPVPFTLTAKAEAALDGPAWPRREESTSGPGDDSGSGFTTSTKGHMA